MKLLCSNQIMLETQEIKIPGRHKITVIALFAFQKLFYTLFTFLKFVGKDWNNPIQLEIF